MNQIKKKFPTIGVGELTYKMFLRIALHLKKETKKEATKHLIDDLQTEKTQQNFRTFLKNYPEFPESLDKGGNKKQINLNNSQDDFIENIMRNFNFRNRSRFFQYIIYFHYKNIFKDFDRLLAKEKIFLLSPHEGNFDKFERKFSYSKPALRYNKMKKAARAKAALTTRT